MHPQSGFPYHPEVHTKAQATTFAYNVSKTWCVRRVFAHELSASLQDSNQKLVGFSGTPFPGSENVRNLLGSRITLSLALRSDRHHAVVDIDGNQFRQKGMSSGSHGPDRQLLPPKSPPRFSKFAHLVSATTHQALQMFLSQQCNPTPFASLDGEHSPDPSQFLDLNFLSSSPSLCWECPKQLPRHASKDSGMLRQGAQNQFRHLFVLLRL